MKTVRGFCLVFSAILAAGLLLGCGSINAAHDGGMAPAVPDDNFHVYIAFGQSNMQGPGAIEAQDREGINSRFQVLNVMPDIYNMEFRGEGQWYRAVPPLLIPDRNIINWKGLPTGLSPADYFGRTLVENTPDTVRICVVAIASCDLALAAFDKTRSSHYYHNEASETARQGMDRYSRDMYGAIIRMAKIAQRSGVIRGIIVHQGETGVGLPDVRWGDLLKTIYDDMLADLGLEPNSLPILAGQTFNGGSGRTGGDLNIIGHFIPNAHMISSIGCEGRLEPDGTIDNIHFGSAGLREIGRRYGYKMLELNY